MILEEQTDLFQKEFYSKIYIARITLLLNNAEKYAICIAVDKMVYT